MNVEDVAIDICNNFYKKVTGHGVPQITAIYSAWKAIRDYGSNTGYYVPIIADGGIRCSGDIIKCFW